MHNMQKVRVHRFTKHALQHFSYIFFILVMVTVSTWLVIIFFYLCIICTKGNKKQVNVDNCDDLCDDNDSKWYVIPFAFFAVTLLYTQPNHTQWVNKRERRGKRPWPTTNHSGRLGLGSIPIYIASRFMLATSFSSKSRLTHKIIPEHKLNTGLACCCQTNKTHSPSHFIIST